jgi:hypothetical protein
MRGSASICQCFSCNCTCPVLMDIVSIQVQEHKQFMTSTVISDSYLNHEKHEINHNIGLYSGMHKHKLYFRKRYTK